MTRSESKRGESNPMFGKKPWNWKADVDRYPSGAVKHSKPKKKSVTGLSSYDPNYHNKLWHMRISWAARNPEKVAAKRRKRTLRAYGLTPELWEIKFNEQGRACAICRTKETSQWHTDHCHESKVFRGILCKKCNNGIGQLNDDAQIVLAAFEYLKTHKG